jgi:hypothetical protein
MIVMGRCGTCGMDLKRGSNFQEMAMHIYETAHEDASCYSRRV